MRPNLMAALGAALVIMGLPGTSLEGPSGASSIPPAPTSTQVSQCERAVTGHSKLSAKQVANCWRVVRHTGLIQSCPKNPADPFDSQHLKPDGYIIDLAGGYEGIKGKAAHSWAIRAGHRPYLDKSSATQESIDAAICGSSSSAASSATVAGNGSSPTRPLPLGTYANIDGWKVKVISVIPEPEDTLAHTPPPAGYVFEVYTIQGTRTSKIPSPIIPLNPVLLGTLHVTRGPGDSPDCYGGTPNNATAYQGGVITDSTCVSMTTADASSFVLGMGEDPTIWFAVK